MDVREKLVELVDKARRYAANKCHSFIACAECDHYGEYDGNCRNTYIAESLIADGVTVQEWISVKERLPQENEPEGAICEQVQVLLDNGIVSTGWCNRHTKLWWHLNYGETHFIGYDYEHTPVIAWQPLPQPPKGD